MSDYIPFLVIGIVTGTVFGLSAMGLVLTYKTTGVFNLGHGAVGAGAAVLFYQLRERNGLPTWLAAFLAIVVFGIVVGAAIEPVARQLAKASTTYRVAATVGLIVAVQALVQLIYGPVPPNFKSVLTQERAFTISGVQVTYEQVIITVFGVASAVALYLFFRRTRTGRAMRAVVDSPELLDMTGVSPIRVRRAAWMIGSGFSAVSGVLLASTQQQLDITLLSLLVVQALGAAAVGSFTSLPLSFAGGIIVGILQAVTAKVAVDVPSLDGINTNMPFIVLFVLLLVLPRNRLIELGGRVKPRTSSGSGLPQPVRLGIGGAALIGAVLVPFVVGLDLVTWNVAMSQVLLFLSLGLLVKTSGQISLAHVGFLAIGAAVCGHMLGNGTPWFVAVLLAGIVAVPVGALIAIPAIRLSGLYLALATLGFGILLANYFYGKSYFFGSRVGLKTSRPSFAESDKQFYFVLLAFALLGVALVITIERARLGRLLRGISDSPVALQTLGVSSNVTLVLVFCISAFMAGVSGALNASVFGGITQDAYSYFFSLIFLTVLVFSGTSTVVAGIVAPLLSVVLPGYITDPDVKLALNLAFGVIAVLVGVFSEGRLGELLGRFFSEDDDVRAIRATPSRAARRGSPRSFAISQSRSQEVRPHATV